MFQKYTTEEDLLVLLEPIKSVVSVSVGLWIKTGSRDENEHQHGYAHFLEHMLFKGTKNYSVRELAQVIDRVGGQHNAATNREYTCFYINVVYDHIELAIKVLADMYYNSLLEAHELKKEKNVIIEEIRMYEDTPDELIHDLFVEKMLSNHSLSHSILGDIDSISTVSRDSLLDFYQSHYTNDNAIFVISGNFDVDKVKEYIAKYFSMGTKKSKKLPDQNSQPVRADYFHVQRNLEQIHFCLGLNGIKKQDDDRWPLYVLSTILGGSMSSRLFQNIREKEGISYSIYSFHSSYHDCGIFGIYCATAPDTFHTAIDLIVKECQDLIENGITNEEFEDSKSFMLGNLALSLESIEVRMGQLAKNEISFGRNYTFKEINDKIKNISLDDFKRISDRIFKDQTFSIISIGKLKEADIIKLDLSI